MQGALVAGVDVRDLFGVYSRDPHRCVSPGADLASLARHLQQHYALAGAPVLLIGHSAGATWFALHGLDDRVCPAAEAREFVSALHGSQFVGLPGISHSWHHIGRWWPMFDSAWHQLTAP
jgi:pimeloyl-ACP methyl ester carboxylesterase